MQIDPTAGEFAALATQQLLLGISDNPGQFDSGRDPMTALFRQAERAANGDDGGMQYLSVPF